MIKAFVASFFLFSSTLTFAAGFSSGDLFYSNSIAGRLNISCNGPINSGPSFGNANCYVNYLSPKEYDFFVGPKINADTVSIQVKWENGKKSVVKTEKYDGEKGQSKKSFNLWVSSLLQRPLLDVGINQVNYTLTKNGNIVEAGSFNVEVRAGEERVCQNLGMYFSSNNQDCAQASNFCDRYFSEQNYCR